MSKDFYTQLAVLHYTLASTSVVEPAANADAAQESHDERKVEPKQWDIHPNIDGYQWWSLENHLRTNSDDAEGDFKCQEVERKAADLWWHCSNIKIRKIGRGRVNPTIAITQMSFSSVKLHFLSKGREIMWCYICMGDNSSVFQTNLTNHDVTHASMNANCFIF